jgi:hypothetical protein
MNIVNADCGTRIADWIADYGLLIANSAPEARFELAPIRNRNPHSAINNPIRTPQSEIRIT